MTFFEKLHLLRVKQNMTQTDLANALGVTRQTVYKWETGQSYPEAMTLWQMRLLFDISLDVLLDPEAPLFVEKEVAAPETQQTPTSTPTQEEEEKETLRPQKEAGNADEKKKGFFSRLFGR